MMLLFPGLVLLLAAACAAPPQVTRGPYLFDCGGPTGVFVVTYLGANSSVMHLRRDREEVELSAQPSGSGTHYAGNGASFREHQGEAEITWATEKPMTCKALGEHK